MITNKAFILVHLGVHFFDYINDCITQIKNFNNEKIYLIINNEHNEKIRHKDVILIDPRTIKKSKNHLIFDETNRLDDKFRDGFWKFTTERFLYIEDLMREHNLENVFHLENDNLIYFNVNKFINIFNKNYNIGAIFDNDQRCIPGFIYIRNIESISKFNSYSTNYPTNNDMELFSLYNNENDIKMNLPILPSNYDSELKSLTGLITNKKELYFNHFDKFKSIFDGASIGQYLGGIDPRNTSNTNTKGFINESTLFDVSKFIIQFEFDGKKRKIPYIIYKNKKIKINNLHIHCKNLKQFMS